MVWIALSVSLKASTQVYTIPLSVSNSSGCFDRKWATSSTVQLEAGKCRSQRSLLFSSVCSCFCQRGNSYVKNYCWISHLVMKTIITVFWKSTGSLDITLEVSQQTDSLIFAVCFVSLHCYSYPYFIVWVYFSGVFLRSRSASGGRQLWVPLGLARHEQAVRHALQAGLLNVLPRLFHGEGSREPRTTLRRPGPALP